MSHQMFSHVASCAIVVTLCVLGALMHLVAGLMCFSFLWYRLYMSWPPLSQARCALASCVSLLGPICGS